MFYYDIETKELKCAPLTELTILKKARTIENSIIVDKFQAEYIVLCDDCGELINKGENDYYITHDGNIICQDCYDNSYYTCEDCGEIHHSDDMYVVDKGKRTEKFVCTDCINDYEQCINCNDYFSTDYVRIDNVGNAVCDDCGENYYICDDCGEFVHCDDAYFDDNDYCYCSDCYYNNGHDEEYIHNYDYVPDDLKFNKTLKDVQTDNNLYYGFELEVSTDRNKASDFLNNFDDDNIYLTNDSSIVNGGYEITSHPMTYDYLFNSKFTEDFKKGLEYLQSINSKGHNYGGLHIHISRNGISMKQIAIITAFLYKNTNFDTILKITQRKKSNIDDWASLDTDLTAIEVYNTVLKDTYLTREKYEGVNFKHYDTIEFRIFNSNLRFDRLKKNFEFIQLLIDYTATLQELTKDRIIQNTHNFNINTVLCWATLQNNHKYDTLLAFINEKTADLQQVA